MTGTITVPQPSLPDVVIRASAGTGKTFQLSNRYLAELNAGVPTEEILATTFTRKAAGEILERILIRLAEAAVDETACRELGGFLADNQLTCKRSAKLLQRLTNQLHRVQVSTLDAFFSKVSTSFGLELGMPPGWRILDDLADRQLRLRAVDEVLTHGTPQDVSRLMHLLTKGDAGRSVTELLMGTVNDLYSIYQQTSAEAWRRFPQVRPLPSDELRIAIEAFETAPLLAHKQLAKSHAQACHFAVEQDWESFISCRLSVRISAGNTQYHRKELPPELIAACRTLIQHARAIIISQLATQTEATRELLERFDGVYARLKHDAHGLRFEDVTRVLADAAISKRIGRLAFRLDSRLSHLLLDEFQDTSLQQWQVLRPLAQRLLQLDSASENSVSAEVGPVAGTLRVPSANGSRSEPATLGSLDSRRSFFCVGDVKQAIYGWRGGKAEIFEALTEELPGLREESLNTSYRSAPAIIETVNGIFAGLSNHGNLEQYRDAVERWCNRFPPHTTHLTDLPGYACLVTAPRAPEGEKQQETTLPFAADRIAKLVQDAAGHSVGVLVRKNRIVARLIFELRRRGIAASEEGGSPLTDSAAVQLLLSLLRLADHPGDTAAAFHVARSPLGPLVSLTDDRDAPAVDALAEHIRRELSTDGYGATLERLSRLLVPSCNPRDLRRLQQLVEVAFGFESNATLRPGDFVRHVENESVADPTDADVRVMTYHQAKGLEFDIVVLPELDADLVGRQNSFVTGQPGPTQPIDHVCRYRNQDIQNLLPADLRELFRKSADQQMTEALCLVYVAVTRAVHALHMIIAPSSDSESKLRRTPAGLLRAALTDGRPTNPTTTLYETGNRNWFEHTKVAGTLRVPSANESAHEKVAGILRVPSANEPAHEKVAGILRVPSANEPAHEKVAGTLRVPSANGSRSEPATFEDLPTPAPVTVRLAPMPDGRSRGLNRATPSSREGGSKIKLANVLRLGNAAAMDRGTLIHAWFEQVRWLDEDGFPPDDKLRQVVEELDAATHLDVERILGEFHGMLRSPAIVRALTRKSYCPPHDLNLPADVIASMEPASLRLEVQNEHRFAVRENDAVVSGVIDRLVLIYDDLKLLAADIIDFKTDAIPAGDPVALSARVAYYRGQLEAYRPAVAAMHRLSVEHVSARLLMVGAGVVENV